MLRFSLGVTLTCNSIGLYIFSVWLLATLPNGLAEPAGRCLGSKDCGWNSYCDGGQCTCFNGHTWARNNKDCISESCDDPNCLDCVVKGRCKRCVNFIEEGTGKCLDSCASTYALVVKGSQVGRVCPAHGVQGLDTVLILVLVCLGAGLLITCFLVLALYYRYRSQREKKKRIHYIENIYSTSTKQAHRNNSYLEDPVQSYRRSEFIQEIHFLHAYTDTFLNMLSDVKARNNSVSLADPRTYMYRNVIHQLCRVITLLTQREIDIELPEDGTALLAWARRSLRRYLQANSKPATETRSNTATLKSTFKPDHRLVPNGHHVKLGRPSTSSTAYTYERWEAGAPDGIDMMCQPVELEFHASQGHSLDRAADGMSQYIYLEEDYTDPVQV